MSDRGCGSRYSYRLYGTDESEDLPLPSMEYRLMWYTDLLSSHRGTSEYTPPHCCSAVLLSQAATFSLPLSRSSLFPCLSPAFPFCFYFLPFLSRVPLPSASLSLAFVSFERNNTGETSLVHNQSTNNNVLINFLFQRIYTLTLFNILQNVRYAVHK